MCPTSIINWLTYIEFIGRAFLWKGQFYRVIRYKNIFFASLQIIIFPILTNEINVKAINHVKYKSLCSFLTNQNNCWRHKNVRFSMSFIEYDCAIAFTILIPFYGFYQNNIVLQRCVYKIGILNGSIYIIAYISPS